MKTSRRYAMPLAGMLALALTGCARADASAPVLVEISGAGFDPATVSVTPGTEIRWVNRNTGPVSVTTAATSPSGMTALPDGAEPFDSGPLRDGEVFSVRVQTPGTYVYWSEPQLDLNWAGTIHVGAES